MCLGAAHCIDLTKFEIGWIRFIAVAIDVIITTNATVDGLGLKVITYGLMDLSLKSWWVSLTYILIWEYGNK